MTWFRRLAIAATVIVLAWAAPKALRRQAEFTELLKLLLAVSALSTTQANQDAKLRTAAGIAAAAATNAAAAAANAAAARGLHQTGNAAGSGSGIYNSGNAHGSGSGVYATGAHNAQTSGQIGGAAAHVHDYSHSHDASHAHDASHIHNITI